ncbi:hypothetical protein A2697_05085 [Candidatus Curtissbacteria bacterium RIFCSPHIGHO2_01_FULL_41_44]|uniref:HD domain-containing protein n=1 Tax=Candidatus Curtissbacteria bacterium RIFCSPLOWO2_01_FULL_42_50 TaxID=1797730 RepID=A0A1F5H5U9_9BACT|nr:MAG: hypothetical protein A2697_05085 [Candidatus Curtissbacteria bacterium RIFCSPHIGHO2_01_FULL_41_44]OGD93792.1 MAG: hypothetical protein A3C33_03630 [Candidatus Curtissbacteria bacterium RIFCSPHIGHO2_02_FULL_42_58]OGD96824.1 MAG: hypothetical protein A3E71_02870 [Candidatus Curtissbacteria bacterium RIFCSPHIGHO2_12_FULL_42_33]OGD99448.1 MAG: hypothetical protein A3B54_00960 [Candidatus Curtissbacteria bacterium RIFCSPLOWO2_01_FULL_42_50]OGE03709.1 MAG: hypothetical protein A3G16_02460 [Ca
MKENGLVLELANELFSIACEENRSRESEMANGIEGEKEHGRMVLLWVGKLVKNPSVELQLSALFHDIDRVVTPGVGEGFAGDRKSKAYKSYKKTHAKRSADYICPKLIEKGIGHKVVERTRFLILHHDDTGAEISRLCDEELDVLVAADSLAFFSSVGPRLYELEGKDRLRDKIRFMVEKMPKFARTLLSSERFENEVFNRLKDEVLGEQK